MFNALETACIYGVLPGKAQDVKRRLSKRIHSAGGSIEKIEIIPPSGRCIYRIGGEGMSMNEAGYGEKP
jgi:hypothetical protein